MQQANQSSQAPAPAVGWGMWLRERLFPQGDNIAMIASYVMITTSIIVIVLQPYMLQPWRMYSAVLALAVLLVLNVLAADLGTWLPGRWGVTLFFGASALLFLLANWLTGAQFGTFLPFLLFMLVSQGIMEFGVQKGLLYGLAVGGCWFGVLWLIGVPPGDMPEILVSMSMGMIFTIIFSVLMVRLAAQNRTSEMLLARLQQANAELHAAREREKELAVSEERVRLARDIHDGLGHHLTVLNVQLQAAAKLVSRDPERAVQTIAVCREQAQAALDEVRHSVAAMRRTPLDGRSLDEALAALVHDFGQRATTATTFAIHGTPRTLPLPVAMTLFRAAQEGLTNVQKHASASSATVTLTYAPADVQIEVRDNGTGAGAASNGFGLAGLRERAGQLGGEASTGTPDNGGFVLDVRLPVATVE